MFFSCRKNGLNSFIIIILINWCKIPEKFIKANLARNIFTVLIFLKPPGEATSQTSH